MILDYVKDMNLPRATFARFVLAEDKCTGCGRCVQTCPIQLLCIRDKKARPNNRYDFFRCITCQNCAAVCENSAITIVGDYRVSQGFWKNDHLYPGTKTFPAPLPEHEGKDFSEFAHELTETERVIYARRSGRLYRKKKVPRELIRRVIEAGRFAPSAGNNQPWKFVVLDDAAEIAELGRRCHKALRVVSRLTLPRPFVDKEGVRGKKAGLSAWQQALLPLLIKLKTGEVEPRARGGINASGADPDYPIFFGAPCLILLLADSRGIGNIFLDTGICGQNMVLAAHSLGLSTCYVSLAKAASFFPDLKKSLKIEKPFKIVTSLTLGYPRGRTDKPVAREQPRIEWVEKL
ncbi:MAG: nitroreductase family protein [Thermodesulfobacteriota bacterium]